MIASASIPGGFPPTMVDVEVDGKRYHEMHVDGQGIGDLYRIYATTQRDGVNFKVTFVPSTFNVPHKEEFDNEYMRKLYYVIYDLA
jgi:predicted acylesterase/phospholipase RssA